MSGENAVTGETAAAAAAAVPDLDNVDTTTDDEAFLEGSADENDCYRGMMKEQEGDGEEEDTAHDDQPWSFRYEQLLDFFRAHGHSRVKQTDNPELFKWCVKQRKKFELLEEGKSNGNACSNNQSTLSPLTPEQLDLLAKANFPFNLREFLWHERYEELKRMADKYGSPNSYQIKTENHDIYVWSVQQQSQYAARLRGSPKGRPLTPERIQLLEKINFSFQRDSGTWMRRYHELIEYKKECGNCEVPSARFSKWTSLGYWVGKQREYYTRFEEGNPNHYLTEERIDLLRKIGFTFRCKVTPKDWIYRYNELVEYTKKYGDTLVPKNWPVNKPLYYFVYHQRKAYTKFCEGKRSPMTQEKVDMLNKINFAWRLREPRHPKNKRKLPPEEEEDVGKELQRKAEKANRESKEAEYQAQIAQDKADHMAAEAERFAAEAREKAEEAKRKAEEAQELGKQATAAMLCQTTKKRK